MENLTHSLSKKSYGGFGMASHKSVYDDVFGGPPKFGVTTLAPRFEDYTEIFGGFHSSRGSSIPILDLPVVEEVEMAFDVRSSRLEDYSEVFGGFDGFDFAVSFEDLVMRKSNGGDDSSDDAWSPVQSESISDESDLFAYSERSQGLLNTDAHHQFGDVRQLNVSDHNVNQKTNEKLSNRVAHVGQVHAIPGHAYMVNEAHASPIIEYEGPPLQAGDLNSKAEFLGRIVEKRCFKESISLPKNSGIIATESDTHHVESSESAFAQKKPFVTVNDISLRTRPSWLPPPSRPPPVFAVRTREPEKPYSKLRALNSYAFERMAGEGSPPFYDVEIDASSSKVASEAMEVAKEKTQAKTRKESMETKDVLQSHLKLQARDIIKSVDEMINKASNSCKDDIVLETFARGGNEIQSTAQEMKTVTKGTQEASDLIDQEKCIDLVENPTHRRHTKESLSQVSHKPTGSFAWRQESEYFELAETDISLKAVEQFEDDKSHVLQSIGSEEYIHASKTATGESPRQEVIKEVKAEAPKLEETRNELEIKEHTCEWDVNRGRSNKTMESSCQKENQKNAEVDFNACESEMGKKRLKRDKQHGDKTIEKDADKSVRNAEKAVRHVAEVEFKGKLNGFSERTDSYKVINDVHAKKANERRQRECFLHEEYYKNPGEAVERVQDVKWKIQQEDRKWQEESSEREGNEQKQKEVYQSMENLVILEEVIEQEDRAERFSSAIQYKEGENDFRNCEQEDEERHQNPDCEIEEKKRSVLETHDLVEDEKQFDVACETGELDARLTDFWKLESGKDGSMVVNEKEDTEENARLTRVLEGSVDTSQSTIKNEEMIEQSELVNPIKWDGNDRMVNLDQGIYDPQKGWNINSLNGEYELKDNMHETLEATQAANLCEDDQKLKTEFKDGEGGLDLRTSKLTGEEISLSYGRNQHDKYKIHMEHATESHCLHDHVVDSDGAGTGIGNSANKQDDKVSQLENDLEKKRGNAHERGKRGKLTNGVQVTFSEEILKEKSRTRPISEELSESEKKTGAAIPSVLNDRKNSFNTCQRGTICNAETKGRRVNVALTPEERKIKQRLHQERELENEHIRRIEEERDRAREREKDRMAVDKAALEARERSYAEAREGAERAVIGRTTAEVRQRAGMEGRGRLDMESMEARIRAERAAVERATAEARQRAFEKTMTAKASFESRERVERSVPDQLYAYSRNAEMRRSSFSDPPDLQTQSSGTSNVFHYSYSSVNAGVEGESPQRCKARLERYRRTAERAAKALAEKNMRDLFAQREQTERTRLAEPLDAEVRRWSSGKEGNLRALLSTLQYILGPDSGWQPIPLTEVITTVAVKKAYRKATLCVHPDKLQQRGASIQQKYICEKVFDLLKEAWNTFNSEER